MKGIYRTPGAWRVECCACGRFGSEPFISDDNAGLPFEKDGWTWKGTNVWIANWRCPECSRLPPDKPAA